MTQEEKNLLLKDLCSRLLYDPIVYVDENLPRLKLNASTRVWEYIGVDKPCKPYLRPMSSMTEEEKAELNAITDEFGDNWFEAATPEEKWKCTFLNSSNEIDWLNAHHFDYRDLISKGLALEALEDMYKQ